MFDAIAIYSKNLTKKELKIIKDLISAKSIEKISVKIPELSQYYEAVSERRDCSGIFGYKLTQFAFDAPLFINEPRPLLLFKDQDAILEKIQTYGRAMMIAQRNQIFLKILKEGTSTISEEKRKLELHTNNQIDLSDIDALNSIVNSKSDEILQSARGYYSDVSRMDA